jgi:hypothetical protein
VLQRGQQLAAGDRGEQQGDDQGGDGKQSEQRLGEPGRTPVRRGDPALVGEQRGIDRGVRGPDLVEQLPGPGGAGVPGVGDAGVDHRVRERVEPLDRRGALRGEQPPRAGLGGAGGDLVERGERADPPLLVRLEEALVAGELEPAHARLGVGHVLQDRGVGVAGRLDPGHPPLVPRLQAVADQELGHDDGDEQHEDHDDARVDPRFDRDHLRRPAGFGRRYRARGTRATRPGAAARLDPLPFLSARGMRLRDLLRQVLPRVERLVHAR